MLIRNSIHELESWSQNTGRRPLVVLGARQVGKSYLIREFGRTHYRKVHEINFWEKEVFKEAFEASLSPDDIVDKLQLILREEINLEKDLIFFDEIQECKRAYSSLKFFKEKMPNVHVVAAGSYLGLLLSDQTPSEEFFVPVGATQEIKMYPLTFMEFLQNTDQQLFQFAREMDIGQSIPEFMHNRFLESFRAYQFVGGMPAAVESFIQNEGPRRIQFVRGIQKDLLNQYILDFAKHSGRLNSHKLQTLFRDIPEQLNRFHEDSVDRYRFSDLAKTQGHKGLQTYFDFLSHARFIIRSFVIHQPRFPLITESGLDSRGTFKAFYFDIGLLAAQLDIPGEAMMRDALGHYKGFMAENFVAQEIYAQTGAENLFSYKKKNGKSEIEFLLPSGQDVIPLEVKSSIKFNQSRSMNAYITEFSPKNACRLSPKNIGTGDGLKVLPIYLVFRIFLDAR